MAAFAGEMADDRGKWDGGRAGFKKVRRCEKYFQIKRRKFRKTGTGTRVLSADLSATLSVLHCRLSFHLSFCQTACTSIAVGGALTTEDNRRRRNFPDCGRGWCDKVSQNLGGWGWVGGGDYMRVSLSMSPSYHSTTPPPEREAVDPENRQRMTEKNKEIVY